MESEWFIIMGVSCPVVKLYGILLNDLESVEAHIDLKRRRGFRDDDKLASLSIDEGEEEAMLFPTDSKSQKLAYELFQVGETHDLPWLVCGDLKEILYSFEKSGGMPREERRVVEFRKDLNKLDRDDKIMAELIDVKIHHHMEIEKEKMHWEQRDVRIAEIR
ncbi:hypothetical protein Gohar_025642 [Gossypium harknessii]|uniref:Uncharacterized protein n=1 Tax=Gossypium harknessii TaxID=34285 RepID=A0A7J9IB51_9ROSI|nr:hypothetical protein [Gossypium harknessii]